MGMDRQKKEESVIGMLTNQDVLRVLEALAPPALAEGWDNVGLLVDSGQPVHGILTALDITADTVAEAAEKGCDLLISHHPIIFDPPKRIDYNNVLYKMIRAGQSAICMHTNLDCAAGGTGDTLAALLGLREVCVFTAEDDDALGRIGLLPSPTDTAGLAALCERVLHTPVRFVDGRHAIRRVAVVTGAGDCIADALAAGADALVTGEVRYHHALDAAAAGLSVVEAGHFGTEAPIAAVLAGQLREAFPDIPVFVSERMRDVFHTLPVTEQK